MTHYRNLEQIIDNVDGIHGVKTAGDGVVRSAGLLPRLLSLAQMKYTLVVAYIHYGDQLRAFARDGVFAHFNEHLDEEREQLYQLHKKITALGGTAKPKLESVEWVTTLNEPRSVFAHLQSLEQNAVTRWAALFNETSKDVALNGWAQNYAIECQGHADDMARYLRSST